MSVNGYQVKEKLFSKEKIEMTREEYVAGGRDAVFEFLKRQEDVGNTDLAAHSKSELARLDAEYGSSQVSQR